MNTPAETLRRLSRWLTRRLAKGTAARLKGTTPIPGDPSDSPHYPTKYYATDHVLPYGLPLRGDVMLWIDHEVERHSSAGTLDEGTKTVLDHELDRQHEQWRQAIRHHARSERGRTALTLRDDQVRGLAVKREQLPRARHDVIRLNQLEAHYRDILNGTEVTIPTPYDAMQCVPPAASTGVPAAQVPDLADIDHLMSKPGDSTQATPGPVAGASVRRTTDSALGRSRGAVSDVTPSHDRGHEDDDDNDGEDDDGVLTAV